MIDRGAPDMESGEPTPDVMRVLRTASDHSLAARQACRSAGRSGSQAERSQERSRADDFDSGVFAALLVMMVLCWIGAGLALFLI